MNFSKLQKYLFALCSLSILSACDSGPSLKSICENQSQICDDLNKDAWCRHERRLVILGRYEEMNNPTDDVRFELIENFEAYSKCVHKASLIEHIKLKEKTTSRVNGYVTSLKELERLSEATKDSNHPHLLYWHWSRNGDEEALTKFLKLKDTGVLQTPELQFKLATQYIKYNQELTIDTLYHALELYDGSEELNPEILTTLSSVYLKQEKLKHAYVWGLVAKENGAENIDLAPLRAMLENEGTNVAGLNGLASDYYSAISSGKFLPPKR